MIEVEGLSCFAGKKQILSDVSFCLSKGEFAALIGNNGSGKTTLLKCLTRNFAFQSGKIKIDQKDLSSFSYKELAKKVAFVPQHTDLMFDFSAHQLVLMGRTPYQKPLYFDSEKDLEIVEQAMKQTGTWHLRNSNAKTLSGGEFQRVIIARALAQQTPILMLDEPISNLDIHHQFEVMSLLQEINAKGITVLIILHELNMTMQYCNKVLLMQEGKMVAQGKTSDILSVENIERFFDVKAQISPADKHIIISKK